MILSCTYEELRALASGAELVLSMESGGGGGPVAAPPEARARVTALRSQGTEPIRVQTLSDQRALRDAVALICDQLHERMERVVLLHHPGHEDAVNLYFDYAHTFGVLDRLDRMGEEMEALIEVMTGAPPSDREAHTVAFPD